MMLTSPDIPRVVLGLPTCIIIPHLLQLLERGYKIPATPRRRVSAGSGVASTEGRAFLGGPRLVPLVAVLLPGVLLSAGSSPLPYAVLWCPFLTNANPIRHILAGRASLAGRAAP